MTAQPHPMTGGKWPHRTALAAIILLGALLRFTGLDGQSLWYDETITRTFALVPFSELIPTVRQIDHSPPGNPLIVHLWCRLFGTSDASLRAPSAVAGTASIPVIYLLAARLFHTHPHARLIGLTAALLLATNRYHIAYSQEARTYALLTLAALTSCYALAALLTTRRVPMRILYVLATAAMFWAHPYSVTVLLAQAAFLGAHLIGLHHRRVANPGPGVRDWFFLMAAAVLLFGPWIPNVLAIASAGQSNLPAPRLLATFLTYADTPGLLLLAGALTLAGCARAVRRHDPPPLLPLLILFTCAALPILLSPERRSSFTPRYGIATIIGLCLATAYGVGSLPRLLQAAALVGYLLLATPHLYDDARAGTNAQFKNDVRSAARHIEAHAAAGDGWACHDFFLTIPFRTYVHRRDLQEYDAAAVTAMPPDPPRRLWFVLRTALEQYPDEAEFLRRVPYQVLSRQAFPGVVVLELAPP